MQVKLAVLADYANVTGMWSQRHLNFFLKMTAMRPAFGGIVIINPTEKNDAA